MKLYADNGYLNFDEIMQHDAAYVFIVGGRGIGKTFGAIKHLIEHDIKFMLMRRTQAQSDLISITDFSPINPVAKKMDFNFTCKKITDWNSAVYKAVPDEESGKMLPEGPAIAYTGALSTIKNIRGINMDQVKVVLYDEFIPEPHEPKITEEGKAFLNAYETLNRNRELEGEKPLKMVCLANAFDLNNPVFACLHLQDIVSDMLQQGREWQTIPGRNILIIIPQNSPISRQKANTVLYKLGNEDFGIMALDNKFVIRNGDKIRTMPIKEYRPSVRVGKIAIYIHKTRPELYITDTISGNFVDCFGTDPKNITAFRRKYGWLMDSYYDDVIIYSSLDVENMFYKLLTNKA